MSVVCAPVPAAGRRGPAAAPPHSVTVVRMPRVAAKAVPSQSVYRRRRAVLAVFVAAVVAVVGLAAGGGEASRGAQFGPGMRSYLVQPGDTLWAIAAAQSGAMPMADYVDVLVELNGGAQIRAGEWIVLP